MGSVKCQLPRGSSSSITAFIVKWFHCSVYFISRLKQPERVPGGTSASTERCGKPLPWQTSALRNIKVRPRVFPPPYTSLVDLVRSGSPGWKKVAMLVNQIASGMGRRSRRNATWIAGSNSHLLPHNKFKSNIHSLLMETSLLSARQHTQLSPVPQCNLLPSAVICSENV